MDLQTMRKVNTLSIFKNVFILGRQMFSGLSAGTVKHQVLLLVNAAKNMDALRQWYDCADNPIRASALSRYPLIEGAMYWPYLNHKWSTAKRLQVIDQHYRMLHGPATILAHATLADLELANCELESPGLRLVLEKAPWFLREGELVLSIFVDAHRVYSVAFTLGIEDGQPLIYVGALQGRNIDNVMEIYRNMTHALHGMRPRDFLMTALKFLASALQINVIWGVCTENQQHRAQYFGGTHDEKLVANYDEVWLEHGGIAMGNGFFSLSSKVQFKDMADIPTRKRANYRRRYNMLERLAEEINLRKVCITQRAES